MIPHEPQGAPYRAIKRWICNQITQGELGPGDKIPSENVLALNFGVSRMTANKAVRDLEAEGLLRRRRGSGTFVAATEVDSNLLELTSIARDIEARGLSHSMKLVALELRTPPEEIRRVFDIGETDDLSYCEIIHYEGEMPIQLEIRWVSRVVAPYFCEQDFSTGTPTEYLLAIAPLQHAEYHIEARSASPTLRAQLLLSRSEPVLVLHRTTWSRGEIVTVAELYHPGSRFRFRGSLK